VQCMHLRCDLSFRRPAHRRLTPAVATARPTRCVRMHSAAPPGSSSGCTNALGLHEPRALASIQTVIGEVIYPEPTTQFHPCNRASRS
jgi:hypothetical protein